MGFLIFQLKIFVLVSTKSKRNSVSFNKKYTDICCTFENTNTRSLLRIDLSVHFHSRIEFKIKFGLTQLLRIQPVQDWVHFLGIRIHREFLEGCRAFLRMKSEQALPSHAPCLSFTSQAFLTLGSLWLADAGLLWASALLTVSESDRPCPKETYNLVREPNQKCRITLTRVSWVLSLCLPSIHLWH